MRPEFSCLAFTQVFTNNQVKKWKHSLKHGHQVNKHHRLSIFARFNTSAQYYLRAWHRLTPDRPEYSVLSYCRWPFLCFWEIHWVGTNINHKGLQRTANWAGSLRHTRFTLFLSNTSGLTARKLWAGGWGKALLATLLVTPVYARAFHRFFRETPYSWFATTWLGGHVWGNTTGFFLACLCRVKLHFNRLAIASLDPWKKKAFPVSCEQPALKHVEKVLRYQELPLLRGHIHYASALWFGINTGSAPLFSSPWDDIEGVECDGKVDRGNGVTQHKRI